MFVCIFLQPDPAAEPTGPAGGTEAHNSPATAKHRPGLVGLITKNPERVHVRTQAKSTKPDNVRVGTQAISRNKPLITVPLQIARP